MNKDIINSLKSIQHLIGSSSFKNKSGSQILKKSELFNEATIEFLIERKILKDTFLLEMYKTEESSITVGQKRKIKNVISKQIEPNLNDLINEFEAVECDEDKESTENNTETKEKDTKENCGISKDFGLDLGLPALDEIMLELKREKSPLRIQSNHKSKFVDKSSIEDKTDNDSVGITLNEDSITETDNTIEKKVAEPEQVEERQVEERQAEEEQATEEQEEKCSKYTAGQYVGKCNKVRIMDNVTAYVYNHFKNRIYTKGKIEVFVNQRVSNVIEDKTDENSFDSIKDEIVNIVICDKETMDTICVIMLTNDNIKLEIAQAISMAGIKLFRLRCSNGWAVLLNNYDLRLIEETINNFLAPTCPMCGLPMRQKENMKTRHRFYACMDNQKCRHTIDID